MVLVGSVCYGVGEVRLLSDPYFSLLRLFPQLSFSPIYTLPDLSLSLTHIPTLILPGGGRPPHTLYMINHIIRHLYLRRHIRIDRGGRLVSPGGIIII